MSIFGPQTGPFVRRRTEGPYDIGCGSIQPGNYYEVHGTTYKYGSAGILGEGLRNLKLRNNFTSLEEGKNAYNTIDAQHRCPIAATGLQPGDHATDDIEIVSGHDSERYSVENGGLRYVHAANRTLSDPNVADAGVAAAAAAASVPAAAAEARQKRATPRLAEREAAVHQQPKREADRSKKKAEASPPELTGGPSAPVLHTSERPASRGGRGRGRWVNGKYSPPPAGTRAAFNTDNMQQTQTRRIESKPLFLMLNLQESSTLKNTDVANMRIRSGMEQWPVMTNALKFAIIHLTRRWSVAHWDRRKQTETGRKWTKLTGRLQEPEETWKYNNGQEVQLLQAANGFNDDGSHLGCLAEDHPEISLTSQFLMTYLLPSLDSIRGRLILPGGERGPKTWRESELREESNHWHVPEDKTVRFVVVLLRSTIPGDHATLIDERLHKDDWYDWDKNRPRDDERIVIEGYTIVDLDLKDDNTWLFDIHALSAVDGCGSTLMDFLTGWNNDPKQRTEFLVDDETRRTVFPRINPCAFDFVNTVELQSLNYLEVGLQKPKRRLDSGGPPPESAQIEQICWAGKEYTSGDKVWSLNQWYRDRGFRNRLDCDPSHGGRYTLYSDDDPTSGHMTYCKSRDLLKQDSSSGRILFPPAASSAGEGPENADAPLHQQVDFAGTAATDDAAADVLEAIDQGIDTK